MRALILAVLLTGCGAGVQARGQPSTKELPDCISTCGVLAFGIAETCEEFNAVEASLLDGLSDFWTPDAACKSVAGVSLRIEPERLEPFGYGGLIDSSQMTVYLTEAPLRTGGAWVHEFVHVLDLRDNQGGSGLDHADWDQRGLLAAMNLWHSAQVD